MLKCKDSNEATKSFCLLSFKAQDKTLTDTILKDLERGTFSGNYNARTKYDYPIYEINFN
jgi:hypothetical protein